jgi:hypothetical protein
MPRPLGLLFLAGVACAAEDPLGALLHRIKQAAAAEGASSALQAELSNALTMAQTGSCDAAPATTSASRTGGLVDGGGCQLMQDPGGWTERTPSRALNFSTLPAEATTYVCYDGRTAAKWDHPAGDEPHPETTVLLIENFLAPEEASSLAALMKVAVDGSPECVLKPCGGKKTRFAYTFPGAQYSVYPKKGQAHGDVPLPNAGGQPPPEYQQMHTWYTQEHPKINMLEQRIADLVNIPAHPKERMLQGLRTTPNQSLTDSPGIFHLDPSNAMARHVTALIYLNDIERGGHTAFPLLPRPNADGAVPRPAAMRAFAREVSAKFAEAEEPFRGRVAMHEIMLSVDPRSEPRIVCPAGNAFGPAGDDNVPENERSLAVQPRAGRAVVWWHKTADGKDILHDTLHGGCDPYGGEKLALQKFKQYPRTHKMCKKSQWCRGAPGGRA